MLVYVAGGVMLVAGLLLMAGVRTRFTAGVIALVLIPITLTIQVGKVTSIAPLYRDITVMGAAILYTQGFPTP